MLNKIVEESSDLFCSVDIDGRVLWANKASNKILGFTPSELKGRLYSEFIHEEDCEKWDKATAQGASKEKIVKSEIRHVHKQGFEILLQCSVVWDPSEKQFNCIGIVISDSANSNSELKDLEKKYQVLFDLSPIPKYVYNLESLQIVDVNQAAVDHYGYSREEFLEMMIQDLRPKDQIPHLMRAIERYQTSDTILRLGIFKHLKKDGSMIDMDISGQKFRFANQTRVMVICHDVTQQQNDLKQRKLLADVRQIFGQEQRLKKVLDELLAFLVDTGGFHLGEIWLTSRDQNLLNLSTIYPKSDFTSAFYDQSREIKTLKKGVGLPGSVCKGKKREIWDHLGIKEAFTRKKAAAKSGLQSAMGIPLICDNEVLGALLLGSKNEGEVLENISYLFSGLESLIGSELKRKQLEEDYNQIFNTAPDIICMIDFEGSFKRINTAGCHLLGYSEDELLNMPYEELIYPEDRSEFKTQLQECLNIESTSKLIHRILTKNGEILWLDWSFSRSIEEGISYGVARNITDQKELQKLLDEATDLAKIGGWHLDLITKKVYWSPMTRELHEVDDDFEPDLESGIKFYREDIRDSVKRHVEKAIESGEPWNYELPIITAKGKEKWIKSIGKVEFKDGTPVRMIGSFQDIHNRKMAELRLQNTADNIPGAIFQYILYPDGTDEIRNLTKGAEELWGIPAEECMRDINLIWNQIRAGGDIESVVESIKRSAGAMEPWHCQFRSRLPNGKLQWHEGFGRPRMLTDKSIIWDSLIIDITDQKELETLLARANEMAKIGSWELNLIQDGKDKMYWSTMTRRILEVDESYEPSLSGGLEFYTDESKKEIEFALNQLVERGENFDLELNITTAEGNQKWVRCMGEAEIANGNPVKIFGSFQDITKRKSYEESLQKLNVNLEQHANELARSNRELEQFAFVTSHDLQEPLRMVTSFLTQLERKYGEQLDEKAHQYIHFAVDGALRMRQIILDLLEFSTVGKSVDVMESVDVGEVVDDACLMLRKAIEEASAVIVKENLPVISAQRAILGQIFQNLIGNAVKYRKENVTPRVIVSAVESEEVWTFSVKDNGIGIDPEYFEKIFIIFQKLHTKEEYAGSGMGLSIVKKIIENLGGDIWVESSPGEGSNFQFTLKK